MTESAPRRGFDPALVVILGGVAAALHVGKLPPALPVLRDALSLSLVQAGFLLSLVQLAGMTAGVVAGLAADSIGLRRSMIAGLLLLSGSSALGVVAHDAVMVLLLRACEGAGLLLAVTPAPSLIRRMAAPAELDVKLGLWGAYMPFGAAIALLASPWLVRAIGWQAAWLVFAMPSLVLAVWIAAAVPADTQHGTRAGWGERLRRTLASRGPWLLAGTFAVYSGQWLAVIGFLPSIYAQAAIGAETAGALTALAAAMNIVGNAGAGRLLRRGVAPQRLLYCGFAVMALGTAGAFMPALDAGALVKYGAVLAFSMFGGLVPGTLFALSVRLAPDGQSVATTVGWMQQLSSLGQFTGPPLVAWVANRAGSWDWTWAVTGSLALAGFFVATQIGRAIGDHTPSNR